MCIEINESKSNHPQQYYGRYQYGQGLLFISTSISTSTSTSTSTSPSSWPFCYVRQMHSLFESVVLSIMWMKLWEKVKWGRNYLFILLLLLLLTVSFAIFFYTEWFEFQTALRTYRGPVALYKCRCLMLLLLPTTQHKTLTRYCNLDYISIRLYHLIINWSKTAWRMVV